MKNLPTVTEEYKKGTEGNCHVSRIHHVRLLGGWVVKIKKIKREKERRRVIEENSNKLG